jgi:hypothetical protein
VISRESADSGVARVLLMGPVQEDTLKEMLLLISATMALFWMFGNW